MKEHFCPRCGTELRTVEVRVVRQVELPAFTPQDETPPTMFVFDALYETRTEVADCVRCTGAY